MSTSIDDPFALPSESSVPDRSPGALVVRGRYRLPNRDGSPRGKATKENPYGGKGWQRVTNLVSAFSDQFGLRMWELGEVLQGVAVSEELYATLLAARLDRMTKLERRAWVESFLEHAKDVSGGNYGSKFGNQRHAVVEEHHQGLPAGHLDGYTRRHLSLYASALRRNQLVAQPDLQERRVLVEELEAVGTLDNILQDMRTGYLHIGDLKTQRKFWTWLEIAAQFACYAHAVAMWDTAHRCWVDMPEVDQALGFVLWMQRHPDDPEERATWEPHVDVYEVDLVEGWKTAQLAYQVVQQRARSKSTANPLGKLRPAPPASAWERMAAQFAACDSLAEGRYLVSVCKREGLWDATMALEAQAAHERLSVPA